MMDTSTVATFEADLDRHLRKAELEYRAMHMPRGSSVDWLAPYCHNTTQIADYLRSLGFRIKSIMDSDTEYDSFHWVTTTSNLIVYVLTAEEQRNRQPALVAKAIDTQKNSP